jgi:hypothetical protein
VGWAGNDMAARPNRILANAPTVEGATEPVAPLGESLGPGGGAEPGVHFWGEGGGDGWRFGEVALVFGFGDPGVEGAAEAGEGFFVLGLGGGGEVGDFVGVGFDVVEFLFGGAVGEEGEGWAGEGAGGFELAEEGDDEEALFLVAIEGGEVGVGGVVADVAVAGVADGADAGVGFVDAIAGAEGVLAGGIGVGAEEVAAVHAAGAGDVGEGEGGGGDVEDGDDVFVDGAGFDLWGRREVGGPADDHGDVEAAVVAPVDAAGFEAAVVGEEEDDGVFEEVVFFELVEDAADVDVHEGGGVEVAGPFLADDGVVGVVGGWGDVFGGGGFGESGGGGGGGGGGGRLGGGAAWGSRGSSSPTHLTRSFFQDSRS